MDDDNQSGTNFLGVIAVLFAIYFSFFIAPRFVNSTVSRQFWCVKQNGLWKPYQAGSGRRKLTYKVSFENQRVVADSMSNLGKCVVYDNENWECRDADDTYWQMSKGRIAADCVNSSPPEGPCFTQSGLIADGMWILKGDEARCTEGSKDFDSLLSKSRLGRG